ncbi:MAG: carbamoyltransferase [Xanthomonadales bacterium]|nr:carbamoyltransferase [Xanthomonadales bacterium]
MSRPQIFLGISDSHDAGVALMADGKVIAAVNEERLNRKKMAAGLPLLSLKAIWGIAGVSPEQVGAVGVAGLSSAAEAIPLNNDFSDNRGQHLFSQSAAEIIDRIPGGHGLMRSAAALALYRGMMPARGGARIFRIGELLQRMGVVAPVHAYDHHDAHLASAYYSSGAADSLVVSNDGFGDGLCSKVALGDPESKRLKVISSNSFFNSLGVYYNFATLICGFKKAHHAGKTTGLAAFGDPQRTIDVFRSMIRWDPASGIYRNDGGVFRNCIAELRQRLAGVSREDVAAGIQVHCEEILSAMVRYHMDRSGCPKVVLVGGVHANVKINQRIAEIPKLESVFVFPNMGDGGLALGAAFLAQIDVTGLPPDPRAIEHVYLGPDYSENEMLSAISEAGLPYDRPAHCARAIAALLAQEKVVARCDGAMEYGPRALGNRSILYPATKPEVNKWLNQQLNRTEFMPFAPVLRDVDADAFLKNYTTVNSRAAEFMTITYDVTDRCKREAPAIVHVDGTARPQVIRREVNPRYYDILTEYHALTGLSVLVNTSYNMHEEPIVCSPRDAVRAFWDSNIDALALGPFIVSNPARSEVLRTAGVGLSDDVSGTAP